jgi:hypothetical protein
MAPLKDRKMPYTPFAERDSAYYSKIAKMRKNPSMPFIDVVFARKASKKGVKARANRELRKD